MSRPWLFDLNLVTLHVPKKYVALVTFQFFVRVLSPTCSAALTNLVQSSMALYDEMIVAPPDGFEAERIRIQRCDRLNRGSVSVHTAWRVV